MQGRQRLKVDSGADDNRCVRCLLSATDLLTPWNSAWNEGEEGTGARCAACRPDPPTRVCECEHVVVD